MTEARVLIAGVGNLFFGDDGFGVFLAQRLAKRSWPEGVKVAEFGIRGFDLASALSVHPAAVFLDCVQLGAAPGTLHLLEIPPEVSLEGSAGPHELVPSEALQWAARMGGQWKWLRLVGCEPRSLEVNAEGRIGLSPEVESSLETAEQMTIDLIENYLKNPLDQCMK